MNVGYERIELFHAAVADGEHEMKEERLQILNMLRDGTITSEEAERLLAALAETERAQAQGSQRRHRTRVDFDLGDLFGLRGRTFTDFFDEDLGEEFHEKMREFKRTMRGAGQEARRTAQEAMREAQESLKETLEDSEVKEAFEQVGKTIVETLEAVLSKVKETADEGPGAEPCGESESTAESAGTDESADTEESESPGDDSPS